MGTAPAIESSGTKAYFVESQRQIDMLFAGVKQRGFLEALPVLWDQIGSIGGNKGLDEQAVSADLRYRRSDAVVATIRSAS